MTIQELYDELREQIELGNGGLTVLVEREDDWVELKETEIWKGELLLNWDA